MFDAANMSDEELRKLVELGIIPEKNSKLQSQYEAAQAIRNAAGPEMRRLRGGGHVNAHPLEFIADVLRKRQAKKDMQTYGAEMEKNQAAQVDGRFNFLNHALGRGPASTRGIPTPQIGPLDLSSGPLPNIQSSMAQAIRQGGGGPPAQPSPPPSVTNPNPTPMAGAPMASRMAVDSPLGSQVPPVPKQNPTNFADIYRKMYLNGQM